MYFVAEQTAAGCMPSGRPLTAAVVVEIEMAGDVAPRLVDRKHSSYHFVAEVVLKRNTFC